MYPAKGALDDGQAFYASATQSRAQSGREDTPPARIPPNKRQQMSMRLSVAGKHPGPGSPGVNYNLRMPPSSTDPNEANEIVKLRRFEEVRGWLVAFYRKHNPEALATVDDTLRQWAGHENEFFMQLVSKYEGRDILKQQKEDDYKLIVETLKVTYKQKIRPIEEAYAFGELAAAVALCGIVYSNSRVPDNADLFFSPFLEDTDFEAKPMILLLGQYSVGKTTFIRHLLGRDFPGMRIGPEPTTDRFVAVMSGKEDAVIPGNALTADASKPFRALDKFGTQFLNRIEAVQCSAKILDSMMFIDTPGVLSGEKQRVGRQYDFGQVVEWFAERADRILLLFDAHKLDISDEFKRVIEACRGHDDKIRVVLNKSDSIGPQQLLRVYGSLMWSLGKVMKTPEVTRVYVSSFNDTPIDPDHPSASIFIAERADLIADLMSLPRNSAIRKVNELLKRARIARLHATIMATLRQEMPTFWGKGAKQKQLLDDLPRQFAKVGQANRVPPQDFPNMQRFKETLEKLDLSKFPANNEKLIKKLEQAMTVDIPDVLGKMSHPDTERFLGADDVGENPFLQNVTVDTVGPPWVVSGTKKTEYENEFARLPLTNGKLQGAAAKDVLSKTGLSNTVLFKIWGLADIDKDGALDADEYALARILIDEAQAGRATPDVLLPSYIPPGKR